LRRIVDTFLDVRSGERCFLELKMGVEDVEKVYRGAEVSSQKLEFIFGTEKGP
jgi:hypothetical protein